MKYLRLTALLPFALLIGGAPPHDGAQFDAEGRMAFPEGYREWVFVTSGHGMSYNPVANAAAIAPFDNVFVNRAAYASFKETGHWPDDTVLVLEIHGASDKGSINVAGAFQSGDARGVEVHVRDRKRFKTQDGWAFFGFDPAKRGFAEKVPESANCYSCHEQHAAVDRTFVQFYPTLLPIAKAKGTLSPAYAKEAQ
jgi:hypothetical protein